MQAKDDFTISRFVHGNAVRHVNDILDVLGRPVIYFSAANDAWALPGDDFTSNRKIAERVAKNIQAAHLEHRKKLARR